jgi:GTP cyclohydrolase I
MNKKSIKIEELETAPAGFSNGISTQLNELIQKGEYRSLNKEEKQKIVDDATKAYGDFLTALGVNWEKDPNSSNTPQRVAKAFLEKFKGRYELISDITSFPSDGYESIVLERNIPSLSVCSHHNEAIESRVHIAYIPGKNGRVVGLSKLNRIVEHFSRRGCIQEQLTVAIHNAVNKICENNIGVIVIITGQHNCVKVRGVNHKGTDMVTSMVSGVFEDHTKTAKSEVLDLLKLEYKPL